MIKCVDRLPGWDEVGELVIVKLVEIDEMLMPVEDGMVLYTTAKLDSGFMTDNIYFDIVAVWGDADSEHYSDMVEAPDDSHDLYYTLRRGYRGWLRDMRKPKDFMIDSWQLLSEFESKMPVVQLEGQEVRNG